MFQNYKNTFINNILYIKANMVVSVCVDKNWAMHGRFFQSLPVPIKANVVVSVCLCVRHRLCGLRPGQWDERALGTSVRQSFRPSVFLSVINLPIIPCPIFRFAYLLI
jgi:hypothetical protein